METLYKEDSVKIIKKLKGKYKSSEEPYLIAQYWKSYLEKKCPQDIEKGEYSTDVIVYETIKKLDRKQGIE